MADIKDFQGSTVTVSNDASERTIYNYTVAGGTIMSATLFRLLLAGWISTKAVLPGTLTLKFKCGGFSTTILSDTMLTGVTASNFVASFDCWLIPGGASDTIVVSGLFSPNATDIFGTGGSRSYGANTNVALSGDLPLSVTTQFSTADTANILTRQVAALLVMN